VSYAPAWVNGNASGRLEPATHWVRACDAAELAAAINRRRRLTYQLEQDFSSQIGAGLYVREATVASAAAPFDNLRDGLAEKVLSAPTGTLGGEPPTPAALDWLWPLDDGDEGKRIVAGEAGAGEVNLFDKLGDTDDWTDPVLAPAASAVRAVHFNELRQTVEWLRRGHWELPLYLAAGLFSPLPDTPWIGESIANDGTNELRAVGFAILRTDEAPPRGLTNVALRDAGALELTADTDCTVQVHRCLRAIDFVADPPTWNEYDPSASAAWTAPGGAGAGDAVLIGSLALTADTPGALTGSPLAAALQAMIDGAEQNFLIRRSDTGPETVALTGRLLVEFDLNAPPN